METKEFYQGWIETDANFKKRMLEENKILESQGFKIESFGYDMGSKWVIQYSSSIIKSKNNSSSLPLKYNINIDSLWDILDYCLEQNYNITTLTTDNYIGQNMFDNYGGTDRNSLNCPNGSKSLKTFNILYPILNTRTELKIRVEAILGHGHKVELSDDLNQIVAVLE